MQSPVLRALFEIAALKLGGACPQECGVLAGAGMRQGSSGKVRLNHCLACLLVGGERGFERQVCRGERVGFGAALGEYVLHGAHLLEGASMRAAGDGDLGAAQGCARLHGSDGLQRLGGGAQVEGLVNVAEGKLYFAVGAQQDEAAAVACLNEVVAGELREFYVEGAAVVGGVSGCLWGGAVGHSSSLNGACGLTLFVSGGAELGWAGTVEGEPCEEIHVYCELKL